MQRVLVEPSELSLLVVDPSVFNFRGRLRSFILSGLLERYKVYIPSLIYELMGSESWEKVTDILRGWETFNMLKPRIASWHGTDEFKELILMVYEKTEPISSLLSELSQEERVRLEFFSEIIKTESPDSIRIVKELLKAAFVKGVKVLSYSSNILRWLRDIPGVALYFLGRGRNRLHNWKVNIKRSVDRAGWKGQIFVWVVGVVAGSAVEAAFKIPLGPAQLVDLLVVLIADGVKVQPTSRARGSTPRKD